MNPPPLIPLIRAARLGLATAGASRAVLGAFFVWLLTLAAVYAADAGPPLPVMAATAAVLYPVTAWATAAHLAVTSPDLRAMLTAANGRSRTLVAETLSGLSWVAVTGLLGTAANLVFDPHPAPVHQRLIGLLLHLVCGLVGVALAFTTHALGLTRGAQTLTIIATALASALIPMLPPIRPVLQAWSGSRLPPSAWEGAWSLLGPLALTAALTTATLMLRRRRP